jgi:hypothetical protein
MIRMMFTVILFSMLTWLPVDNLLTNVTDKTCLEPRSAFAQGQGWGKPETAHPSNDRRPVSVPGNSQKDRQPVSVPEPSTIILLSTGIVGLGAYLFAKKRKK